MEYCDFRCYVFPFDRIQVGKASDQVMQLSRHHRVFCHHCVYSYTSFHLLSLINYHGIELQVVLMTAG